MVRLKCIRPFDSDKHYGQRLSLHAYPDVFPLSTKSDQLAKSDLLSKDKFFTAREIIDQ